MYVNTGPIGAGYKKALDALKFSSCVSPRPASRNETGNWMPGVVFSFVAVHAPFRRLLFRRQRAWAACGHDLLPVIGGFTGPGMTPLHG